MSKNFIGLPPNTLQQREQETIKLIVALRSKGFTEGAYVKPFRVFVNRNEQVKINIKDGIVQHKDRIFRGKEYSNSIAYVTAMKLENRDVLN